MIDVFTRRIVGFGIGGTFVDGATVCRLFNQAIADHAPPKRISTDHDPLFRFHRWLANLRILEVDEIKSVPYVPTSHPFVERLIGTIRREYLDRTFFWNSIDLDRKMRAFQSYYNAARVHSVLNGPRSPTVPEVHLPPLLVSPIMFGSLIVAVYSRPQSPRNLKFAPHKSMRVATLCILGAVLLGGCTGMSRRPAPPMTINGTEPDGYSSDVRLVTTDLGGFIRSAPAMVAGMRRAASGGPINILALSGGGSNGAFGAGALIGLDEAHARPQFQMVTGVSAGALIAPFAFLGPAWDGRLRTAFTERQYRLPRGPATWRSLKLLFFPSGWFRHDALTELVDRYVTPAMLEAVTRQAARGRLLFIATTDIDTQETVMWNMGVIAARGDRQALTLFRDVLVASASVPGIFPPVLIHVHSGAHRYDELHVDGSVTTPIFMFPLIADLQSGALAPLRGAHAYFIINGKLATTPRTTPINLMAVISRSLDAGTTYRTREAILDTLNWARLGVHFRLTEIPTNFRTNSSLDFDSTYMRKLLRYGERCALRRQLWVTPEQANKRNMSATLMRDSAPPACPGSFP